MAEEKPKLERAGGLWQNTTEEGETYLNIRIGEEKYVAFPNTYKKTEEDFDYNIYKSREKND